MARAIVSASNTDTALAPPRDDHDGIERAVANEAMAAATMATAWSPCAPVVAHRELEASHWRPALVEVVPRPSRLVTTPTYAPA